MAVSAVFLDVGGVFHLPDPDLILRSLRSAGFEPDESQFARAHYAGTAALEDFAENDREIWRTYHRAFAKTLAVPAAADLLTDLFDQPGIWTYEIPGSRAALQRLATTGVALAIVSNSDGTLEERLRAEQLCQPGDGHGVCMAAVLDSGTCGFAKPDPRIFELALHATGVAPEEALHVGDTVGADVVGARAAGVTPLHLDPYEFCRDDTHEHIRALDEVVGFVS
jgi:putative hydrolase of the HAD superfamily